jgi:1,4-alpha-glucan branching enzyme
MKAIECLERIFLKKKDHTFTRFCVWAPHAREVNLVGVFNNRNGSGYGFHKINNEGVWVLVLEGNLEGSLYKYEIITQMGRGCWKQIFLGSTRKLGHSRHQLSMI